MKNKKKYMKPLAVGLLASNILAFGSQTVAFAATDKASTKEQAQKEEIAKNVKRSAVSFAATNGTEELSALQKVLRDVLKADNGAFTEATMHKTKEKAESMGVEFDPLEFLNFVTSGVVEVTSGEGLGLILGPLVETIFPKNEKDIWEELEPRIQGLLDERFTKERLEVLKGKLQGFDNNLRSLQQAINVLNGKGRTVAMAQENPGDIKQHQEEVRTKLNVVLELIHNTNEMFKQDEYAAASLPYYVQLGNIHICLLRDLVDHGKDWGYTDAQVKDYGAELQTQIKEYSNQANETFNKGLEKVKKQAEEEGEKKQKKADEFNDNWSAEIKQGGGGGKQYSKAGGPVWDKVNKYVRTMTLSALDFVPQWMQMDPVKYPMSTHLGKTRQVFSDVHDSTGVYSSIEYHSYQDLLKAYDSGYPGELTSVTVKEWSAGQSSGIGELKASYAGPSYDYGRDFTSKYASTKDLGTSTFSEDHPLTKNNFPDTLTKVSDPKQIPAGHKVSKITAYEDTRAFVTAYIPEETRATTKVDGSQIVGIPAEKTSHSTYSPTEEYINGAVAKLSEKAGDTLDLVVDSSKDQKYKVRYRVATKDAANLGLKLKATGQNDFSDIGKTALPNTGEKYKDDKQLGITGLQGTYALVDGPEVTLKKGENTFQITNIDGKTIALDRIELVPEKTPGQGNPGWDADKKHYYNQDGSMAISWQQIDGKWYYFRLVDGTKTTGCIDGTMAMDGKRVKLYFDGNGALIRLLDRGKTVTDFDTLEDGVESIMVE
ncbi:hypothetical protein IIU_00587 [Bacillus cereus VD133]|uniref:Crystaline entomocidal protoxin n=1 Tax=Bacillus cereus VD133 TaxID=1053233 RepID=A0A9W5PWA5_BACCE|nr:insecticidal delta-endotoxin Cry8Ea1 family protein [Bacillus cereus]EOO40707.1 hypothetical protein IIU_00587 [Bacillus cereus VD133]